MIKDKFDQRTIRKVFPSEGTTRVKAEILRKQACLELRSFLPCKRGV